MAGDGLGEEERVTPTPPAPRLEATNREKGTSQADSWEGGGINPGEGVREKWRC
jgi:hypothetical protein